jgi:hypothetical protein
MIGPKLALSVCCRGGVSEAQGEWLERLCLEVPLGEAATRESGVRHMRLKSKKSMSRPPTEVLTVGH